MSVAVTPSGKSPAPRDTQRIYSIAELAREFAVTARTIRFYEDEGLIKPRRQGTQRLYSAGDHARLGWILRGKRLGVLGLAFKGGTDDIRESPAILLVQSLLQEGCQIAAYDPAATARARQVLNSSTEFVNDPYEAARDADALLILTEWEEFAALDLDRIFKQLKYPIVIDGRNLYDPEAMAALGFTYYSVGRPAGTPAIPAAASTPPPARKLKKS